MSAMHIGIAGAGLAGRTLAWRLLRAGCRVTLWDAATRDSTGNAAMTAAAMLAPLAELAIADEVVFAAGQRSMQLWPHWIDQLAQVQPAHPVYYRQLGTLVLAHAADRSSMDRFRQLLEHKLPAQCRSQMHTLDAAAVARLEPALDGQFSSGLLLEGEGQLSNEDWMHGLALELDRLGVVWHEGVRVDALEEHCVRSSGVDTLVDIAVDARGVGARAEVPGLRGVRGEVLRVQCEGVTLQRPVRLMHPRYQLYVVPRPNHRFVVGATELESDDQGSVTLRSMLELGSALYSLHPAFAEARVERLSAALRPAMPDGRPLCVREQGVWHINGLYRHGYLCAPAVVQQLVDNILGETQ